MKYLLNLKLLKPVIPAVVIAAVVILALSGYEPPVYEAKASEPIAAADDGSEIPPITLPETTALPEEARTDATPASGAIRSLNEIDDSDAVYQDGTYEGSAQGFGGTITVRVTIQNGEIADIVIVSASNETPEYFNRAQAVINSILNGQTTNVDVVSGATYSSNGIIQAVRNALGKAAAAAGNAAQNTELNAATQFGNTALPAVASSEKVEQISKVDEKNLLYKDGTYEGSAVGYSRRLPIKVSVVIKEGKIASVNVMDSSGETPEYWEKAKTLADLIVKTQSTNVDTVSGATKSSNGLISAVRNALDKAKIVSDEESGQRSSDDQSKQNTDDNHAGDENSGDQNDPSPADQSSEGDPDAGKNEEEQQGTENTKAYTDGAYSADATVEDFESAFDDYEIGITVTIADGKVTALSGLLSDYGDDDSTYDDNKWYTEDAFEFILDQLPVRAEDIDTVSGATKQSCSSKAILQAIKNALEQAKIQE